MNFDWKEGDSLNWSAKTNIGTYSIFFKFNENDDKEFWILFNGYERFAKFITNTGEEIENKSISIFQNIDNLFFSSFEDAEKICDLHYQAYIFK